MPVKTDAEKAIEYAAKQAAAAPVAPSFVAAVNTTVKADEAKVVAEVKTVDSKLTAFIKANAGKIAVGVIVAAGLLVWHLI